MHLPSPRYSLDGSGIRTRREVAILQPLYDSKPEGYPLPLEDTPAVASITASITEADDSLASTSVVLVTSSLSATEAGDTLTATATTGGAVEADNDHAFILPLYRGLSRPLSRSATRSLAA